MIVSEFITLASIYYLGASISIFVLFSLVGESLFHFIGLTQDNIYFEHIHVLVIPIFAVLSIFSSIAVSILTANEDWFRIAAVNVSSKLLQVLILMLLVGLYGFSFAYLLVAMGSFYFIRLIFLVAASAKYFKGFSFLIPRRSVVKRYVSFFKYSSVQNAFGVVVNHADRLVISKLLGLEVVGLYGFCIMLYSFAYTYLTTIGKVFFPKMARAVGLARDAFFSIFLSMILTLFGLAFLIGLVSVILWKPVISFYQDERFASMSYDIFFWLMILLVIRTSEVLMYYFFIALHRMRSLLANSFINASVTFICYLFFIERFGATGAVYSQILGVLSVIIMQFLINWRSVKNYVTKS